MTTIFDLPMDLAEEIISRVPLKSMRAVRLTCKKWDTLSKTRSFTKTHLAKTAAKELGESQTIMLMDNNLYLKSIVFNGIGVDPSIEAKGKLNCLNDSDQVKISQVFHCEGLLLCILKDTLKLVVWNPYLGQTRWIEPRYIHRTQYGMCIKNRYRYALGYENKKNKSCRSYKILRFMDDNICPPGNYRAPENRFFWYEIYDFDSNLWTTLDVTPHWRISYYQRGVTLKGNTYFCAMKTKPEDRVDDHIICFDFTSERFGPLLCLPFSATWHDYVNLSCVGEEKLAVLLQHNEVNPFEMDIWITTKIETEKVTWSKFLTLDTEPHCPISSSGSFFIDEEKKLAVGFDERSYDHHILSIVGEDRYLKQLVLGKRVDQRSRFKAHICSYVPSLVEIKQNERCKRKKQSSLEKLKVRTLVAIAKPINKERYGLRKRKEKLKTT